MLGKRSTTELNPSPPHLVSRIVVENQADKYAATYLLEYLKE